MSSHAPIALSDAYAAGKWTFLLHERGPSTRCWVDTDGVRVPLATFVRVFNEYVGEPARAAEGYAAERVIACGDQFFIRRNGELVAWAVFAHAYYTLRNGNWADVGPWSVVELHGPTFEWKGDVLART